MHVHEAGAGRPLLLLHGWSCHGGFFQRQFEGLENAARIIAPDLPGHGESGGESGLTVKDAARACADLLEERGLTDVIVAGWSMGALIAWAMLEGEQAHRIAGLAVIDMTPRVLNGGDWHLGLKGGIGADDNERILTAIETAWPAYAPHIAQRIFAAGIEPDPQLIAYARAETAAARPELIAPMWRSLTAQDFRQSLERIACPVRLAYGERSALYGPEVAHWQAARLQRSRLVPFARSGHAPHMEEHAAFNAMLEEMLAAPVSA